MIIYRELKSAKTLWTSFIPAASAFSQNSNPIKAILTYVVILYIPISSELIFVFLNRALLFPALRPVELHHRPFLLH